jgi:flagellar capping protein FliD
LNTYLNHTIGDDGSLTTHQTNLTKQSGSIDTQIADMERHILDHQQQLTDGFVAMESAQAKINQQLQYLTQNFK